MGQRRKRRWSDNDYNLGPFTFARDKFARIGAMLDTGCDIEGDAAALRVHAFGCTLLCAVPALWRLGRQYGAFYSEGMVHMHYGPQTMDSRTEKSKCWSVPWMNWRHVRRSIYGLRGEHIATEPKGMPFLEWYAIEQACPSVTFEFDDFDGERIEASTHITEMEWRLGTRWCKWLSLFCRPRIRRSLDIRFSKETGPKKGSWKGGTIGHGIEMRPGELHESAFRRYCAEHRMVFLGRVVEPAREGGEP